MSNPLRSKQGCWTCRLRKKKCDEEQPRCLTCESLSIECYGYGPKPDWWGCPEEEKAIAEKLKGVVKQARRKKPTRFPRQQDVALRIAPKPTKSTLESDHASDGGTTQNGSVEKDALTADDHTHPTAESQPSLSLSANDSVLLMHFLDHVFPVQYPMYKPGVPGGGRGWLLALLLGAESFHHAALATSAYHRWTMLSGETNRPAQAAALVQQENHLEICMRLISNLAHSNCPKVGLGIAAAVVQLLFFELYTSNGSAWQAHLLAAMNMYERAFEKKLTSFGLDPRSATVLWDNLPPPSHEPVVAGEVANFRFLGGTIIWLDIICSITTGAAPRLLTYHFPAIAPHSETKLDEIMGCRNWIMLQIGRIAALHEQSTRERFESAKFGRIACDISGELQRGLTRESQEAFSCPRDSSRISMSEASDVTALVSVLFIHMASVYLHLVIHGFQKLEIAERTTCEAMRLVQTGIPANILPALVCPLYIFGSVARQEDEAVFRSLFSSTPLLDSLPQHRARILPVLEEIWSKRRSTPEFMWKDSLQLSRNLLLI